jgi:hypothetical protein
MLYVLNSLIIPVDFDERYSYTVLLKKIGLREARELLLETKFISAVGHESTAKLLSELLKIDIPYNRITVKLKQGDMGLHFVLKTRLPEGKVLSEEELRQLEYEFVLSMIS